MGLLLRVGRVLLGATVVASATPACYTAGGGTSPPTNQFYFPVGLAVSASGRVLYAVNSDFDLQWNGGTIQSYDLARIRADAANLVAWNVGRVPLPTDPPIPWVNGPSSQPGIGCATVVPSSSVSLGEGCAPPVDSTSYFKQSAIVGAFATDLQLLVTPQQPAGHRWEDRLLFPVRGSASLTWANVPHDDGSGMTPDYSLLCDQDSSGRCGVSTQAGNNPLEPGNTREVTMPGEPFGMALSQDKTAVAITHQTDTKTSLLTSGFVPPPPMVAPSALSDPTMEFVLDGLPQGGNGIAAVPHDYDVRPTRFCDDPSLTAGTSCTRPAFLQTSRSVAEVDLLRYYDDRESTLHRPFLTRERAFSLTANSVGSDSRGIVIDPTPRLACKARLYEMSPTPSADALSNCGKRPARVFFANRSPPSVVVGEVGELASDGSFDPDAFVVTANVPVSSGPSRVYLAPIVDANGTLRMRLFVVCFDSGAVFIYDPDDLETYGTNATPRNVIYTGSRSGPFAMAFDPMPPECVAIGDPTSPLWKNNPLGQPCPPMPTHDDGTGPYRFGYIANFTESFVQVIDLDAATPYAASTFEEVVFTLGNPTLPKGQ